MVSPINKTGNERVDAWFDEVLKNKGNPYVWFNNFMSNNDVNDPDVKQFLQIFSQVFPDIFQKAYENYLATQVANGSLGANDAYGSYATYGTGASEEMGKYLDNIIAQQNAQTERDFQTMMRDTALTSSGSQLQQLGLAPSNVISVGGASSGVTTNAAEVSRLNTSANRRQQLAMNQYNQRMGMAKSLISMAGNMASSGIYGHALGAARHSAAALASAASHSGLRIMKHYSGYGNSTYSVDENGLLKM